MFALVWALLQLAVFTTASQIPFTESASDYNFTTLELSSLSQEEFTVLAHPQFPSYSVRIRQTASDFCDPSVKSYTGYIDTSAARHLFFYFFESRHDPEHDDVIFWTNGGPGGSSALGLFMELGPCRVVDGNTTKVNPYSWNEKANIFFIDQPIGVGFSYAEFGESVSTTEDAAKDIAAFVSIFFETFSKFKGRGFHLAGESYGGRYLPVYASAIYDYNTVLEAAGVEPINLKSVMIGNGFTDFTAMTPSVYDIMCTPASVEPFVDISTCVSIKTATPRCMKWFKESCIDVFDLISCDAAVSFCDTLTFMPVIAANRNVYDVSKECSGRELEESLCYPITNDIEHYLNRRETRELIGVPLAFENQTFSTINFTVNAAFGATQDENRVQTKFYLENLLDRGVRILIYVGSYDAICNWVGNHRMVDALEWKDSHAFVQQELRPWHISKNHDKTPPAGLVKTAGGLTFLTIEGAGHMVPYDKPVEALELVNRWLKEESFY
ncbi:serine carboxypeptidase [Sistotremastrum suecicum HHB10207 ss-3]|uniref:Carboxypeptidase n=1 Tax=Sistotremastrum suecicum HHB10207 ss-3 TaxID=1314776 RepID=A0A166E1Q8_9AGAM|nr:serine carboxypeptidase [Sistotremastrum suecicum HHB10207 ss-3]